MRHLRLTGTQVENMRLHVEACLPLEACGLLAGVGDAVREVIPISNQAASPVRFRMDPIEQLRALDRIEAQGQDLLGIYHSHPGGPDEPSATDIAEAAYQAVYVIWSRSRGRWAMKAFWIEGDGISEVELDTAAGA
jgi:proteasome lid subunit RPN8/RPN11